jgi:DNA-directed RNA polymerase specialized sigma24 family protein
MNSMTRDEYGQAYQKCFESTVRFLLSRGAERECASEAAQAAWAKGWERLHQLRDEGMVATWVNTIALNAYRRLIRRETACQFAPNHSVASGIPLAALEVARILDACRPGERLLLEQRMRGVTTQEMADKQGASETAIRIRLLRARRAVRMRLEQRAAHLRRAYSRNLLLGCDVA